MKNKLIYLKSIIEDKFSGDWNYICSAKNIYCFTCDNCTIFAIDDCSFIESLLVYNSKIDTCGYAIYHTNMVVDTPFIVCGDRMHGNFYFDTNFQKMQLFVIKILELYTKMSNKPNILIYSDYVEIVIENITPDCVELSDVITQIWNILND